MAARTWAEVSARLGRNDMPAALVDAVAADSLPRAEIAKGLEAAWTMCEWPLQAADREVWLQMFGMVLTDWDMEYLDEDRIRLVTDDLPEYLTLYRGCVVGREAGMSWTTDLDKARWFASRFGSHFGEPRVVTTDVPREWIIARFHRSRSENEYVIDPEDLFSDAIEEVA